MVGYLNKSCHSLLLLLYDTQFNRKTNYSCEVGFIFTSMSSFSDWLVSLSVNTKFALDVGPIALKPRPQTFQISEKKKNDKSNRFLPIPFLLLSSLFASFSASRPAPGVAPHNIPHQAPQYQQQQPPYMMMQPQPPQAQPVPQMWPQQPQAGSPQGQPPQPANGDEVRTLWIGDLQYWMDENYIFNCFAHTGEVSSVKVIRNKQTGQSEGYGFIEFLTRPAAERVLQTYNGTAMPNGAQNFRLNWASAGEKRQDDSPDYTIFVGDLAGDVTDYVLQETFRARYNSVKGAKVVIDRLTGRTKGYGFVKFGDESEQIRAMTEMNGVHCSSRPMRIGPAANKNTSGSQQFSKRCQKALSAWGPLLISADTLTL
uniref:RRM domain-containing protein n=1 Tax=Cucumis sativus TaxID=3659 RepID=A0A0A0LX40_CUCSA